VRNYVMVTWLQDDFEACLDLNLPCVNAASMLHEPIGETLQLLGTTLDPSAPAAGSCPQTPALLRGLHVASVPLCLQSADEKDKAKGRSFVVMSWIKPTVVLRALSQGYVVLMAGACWSRAPTISATI
jgi:hypothetical protein